MTSVYRRILGDRLDLLPESLRSFHDIEKPWRGTAMARIDRGPTILHSLVATFGGLPPAQERCPLQLDITPATRWGLTGELWRRDFGGFVLESFQWAEGELLRESFGWLSMAFRLTVDPPKLVLDVASVRFSGIPIPGFLAPGGTGIELGRDDGVAFEATATAPLLGMVVRYQGLLVAESTPLAHSGSG